MKAQSVVFVLLTISLLFLCEGNPYKPHDVCFLTDHEPMPKYRCSYFAKLISEAGFKPNKPLPSNLVEILSNILKKFSPFVFTSAEHFLSAYHEIIPCLNRHYACQFGYSFIMPSSPGLTILQNSTQIPHLRSALDEMNQVCDAKNVTFKKVSTVLYNIYMYIYVYIYIHSSFCCCHFLLCVVDYSLLGAQYSHMKGLTLIYMYVFIYILVFVISLQRGGQEIFSLKLVDPIHGVRYS